MFNVKMVEKNKIETKVECEWEKTMNYLMKFTYNFSKLCLEKKISLYLQCYLKDWLNSFEKKIEEKYSEKKMNNCVKEKVNDIIRILKSKDDGSSHDLCWWILELSTDDYNLEFETSTLNYRCCLKENNEVVEIFLESYREGAESCIENLYLYKDIFESNET